MNEETETSLTEADKAEITAEIEKGIAASAAIQILERVEYISRQLTVTNSLLSIICGILLVSIVLAVTFAKYEILH